LPEYIFLQWGFLLSDARAEIVKAEVARSPINELINQQCIFAFQLANRFIR
jgi:hypothetical protein